MRSGWTKVEWPYSTFHRYVERGVYTKDWAGSTLTDELGYADCVKTSGAIRCAIAPYEVWGNMRCNKIAPYASSNMHSLTPEMTAMLGGVHGAGVTLATKSSTDTFPLIREKPLFLGLGDDRDKGKG